MNVGKQICTWEKKSFFKNVGLEAETTRNSQKVHIGFAKYDMNIPHRNSGVHDSAGKGISKHYIVVTKPTFAVS